MPTEKYARPGLYRDDDDHARLLDENREKYRRERRERLRREVERGEQARDELERMGER